MLTAEDQLAKARQENREYTWKYWSFHAEQRLKAFNFYLIVVTVLVGGLAAVLKQESPLALPWILFTAGFLLLVLSYAFYRLDLRSRQMIRHAESIMKAIEGGVSEEVIPRDQQLFSEMERISDRVPPRWLGPMPFTDAFRLVFSVFGAFALVLLAVSSWQIVGSWCSCGRDMQPPARIVEPIPGPSTTVPARTTVR